MSLAAKRLCIAVFAVVVAAFGIDIALAVAQEKPQTVPVYGYRVINVYPHDPRAFTQGLFFEDGYLYEGTGIYGKSQIRKVALKTGKILKSRSLPARFFGEGVTIWNNRVIQLTWREKKGFVYEKESFRLIQEFAYNTEGWGLTHDDKRLILSDGSSYLFFLDPLTFKQIGRIEVSDNGISVGNLNELEYVGDRIYANVWRTDRIAVISPETGAVEAWIDLSRLRHEGGLSPEADVLNGIAYDGEKDRLFVTGKFWPKVFEIKIVP
ncbi:MAG TPA: glutaminyl-peptide cyclotransferase [Thermodesulfovibrionales bacterium]|nr:glutaminyl-peptide cyclotransferase [Thermodesulfovibrionales bacterium]